MTHHLIEAGPTVDPERTFRHLMIAGKWALASTAFEEALAHLEQAAERIEVATPTERADLLFHLGTARRSNGRWEEAIDTWKEAVAIAQRGLDLLGDEVSAVRARLLAQQGWIMAAGAAPFELGDARMSQALAIADQLDDPPLRGSCLARLAMNRFFWIAALALLDAAEDNRMPAGQANTWGRWVMLLSAVEGLYVLGENTRAADLYDLVVECIERTAIVCSNYNDGRLVQRSAGIAATAARCWDDAEDHFRTALRQAEELPHLPEQAHTRRFFARMLLDRDGRGGWRPNPPTSTATWACPDIWPWSRRSCLKPKRPGLTH